MRRKIWCDWWKRKYFGLGWGSEQGLSLFMWLSYIWILDLLDHLCGLQLLACLEIDENRWFCLELQVLACLLEERNRENGGMQKERSVVSSKSAYVSVHVGCILPYCFHHIIIHGTLLKQMRILFFFEHFNGGITPHLILLICSTVTWLQ
jgi:hypothetical protein